MRHIIESQQFDRSKLEKLFKEASALEGVRDDSLKGKILASLFYEPSTRTRLSFESAMLRLGGQVLTMEHGEVSSSQTKGETIEDSIRVINNYADVIVQRHPEEGSAKRAAKVSNLPIINAGDGTGQHPTQALLDLYTIERELGRIDGIHIAFFGNLKYYRAPRSLSYLLGKFKDVTITFVTAPELRMKEDVKTYLKRHGVTVKETEEVEEAMQTADVVYQTRVAKEYIKDPAEYEKLKDRYVLNRVRADSMKDGAIIIHPLPRVGELLPEVDDSPHAVYFKQVGYGLLVRMAILKWVLGA